MLARDAEHDEEKSLLLHEDSNTGSNSARVGLRSRAEDDNLSLLKSEDEVEGDPDSNGKVKSTAFYCGLPLTSVLVVFAEFGEQACSNALEAVYVLYMQVLLRFTSSQIIATVQSFIMLRFGFVLVGGYLSDRYFGKKRTILFASIVYFLGMLLITVTASPLGFAVFPFQPSSAIWGWILGLVLVSIGTGGIKANVSPLMADQLGSNCSETTLASAFRYFFWGINVGGLVGMIASPLLKRVLGEEILTPAPTMVGHTPSPTPTSFDACQPEKADLYTGYWVSYLTFALVFLLAIVGFLVGFARYISHPPTGSLLSRSLGLMRLARTERLAFKASYHQLPPNGNHWLDWCKMSLIKQEAQQDWQLVDDLKQTLRALWVFSVFPLYWLLYLQMNSTLVLQASMMHLPGGLTADQPQALGPIFIVVLIPVIDSYVFPCLKKHMNWRLDPITRMSIGFVFASLSMFVAGGLQQAIYNCGRFVPCSEEGSQAFEPEKQSINVFAQVPVYFLMALSEIFASVTSLEFAYSQAPKSMKSVVMGYSLFQTAIGSALGLCLSPIVTEANFLLLFVGLGFAMVAFTATFYTYFRNFYAAELEH